MRAQLGDRLPTFTEAELTLLREAEVDFYGMNYYTSQFARHRTSPAPDTDYAGNLDECQENKAGVSIGAPSGIHWLRSAPQGFRKHLVRIYKKYGKPIYITENGCPCPGEEKMGREESVKDEYRQRYFADHLDAIVGATQDGAKVAGYFAWSLIDNLGEFFNSTNFPHVFEPRTVPTSYLSILTLSPEWCMGYDIRFGVTFTDYDTLERTPKESALKLRGMITDRISEESPSALEPVSGRRRQ